MSLARNGIEGDDTHGHIDDLCRFINEDIVTIIETKRDNNYLPQDNLKRLQSAKLETVSLQSSLHCQCQNARF
jgi:agmatine/peptidylarginine deiminase